MVRDHYRVDSLSILSRAMENVVARKVQSIPCGNHAINIHLRVYCIITHKLDTPVILRIELEDDIEELKHFGSPMVAPVVVVGSAGGIPRRSQ